MVEVRAEMSEGTRVSLSNRRHEWTADEPLDKGGEDTGPSPYELLAGALAACTLITLQLYCRHKGIHLESVSARYTHSKVPAEEAGDAGTGKKGLIDRIESHVTIRGDLTDVQRERLAQIVSRCPVHKTLEGGSTVVDEVEFA